MLKTICLLILLQHGLGAERRGDGTVAKYDCRSHFDSYRVSDDHDRKCGDVRIKILYPTSSAGSSVERKASLYPVVVFFGGALMESNRYQWLGERLVREYGVVFVTTEVVRMHHNQPMLMPLYGGRKKPRSPNPTVANLFRKLKELNTVSRSVGRMNLDKVVVGGHSWGGRVALIDAANDRFFPNVVGAFIYAAHALIFPKPGFVPGSAMSLDGRVPTMLMIGNKDGRLKMTGTQFWTVFTSSMQPVLRTFRRSMRPDRVCYYVEWDGFNHMSMVYPEDDAIPTAFVESRAPHSKQTMTDELYRIISLFVREHAFGDDQAAGELKWRLFGGKSPYIKRASRRGPSNRTF